MEGIRGERKGLFLDRVGSATAFDGERPNEATGADLRGKDWNGEERTGKDWNGEERTRRDWKGFL